MHGIIRMIISIGIMLTAAWVAPARAEDTPRAKLVVSLPILAAPVRQLVQDWADVDVLLKPGIGGAHDAAWPPSAVAGLQKADAVIWVGPDMEQSLVPLMQSKHTGFTYMLENAKAAPWLRVVGKIEKVDAHFWMEPDVLRQVLHWLSIELQRDFPSHANATIAAELKLDAELKALERELDNSLLACRPMQLVVMHDGFRYWERAYGIRTMTSLGGLEGAGISGMKMGALKSALVQSKACCLITEPEQQPAAEKLGAELGLPVLTLDPLGLNMASGQSYAAHMRQLAATVANACQADSRQ